MLSSMTDVRLGLARLGIDDARRVYAELQDLVDLCLRGTVKARSECGEQTKNLWVRVALDR